MDDFERELLEIAGKVDEPTNDQLKEISLIAENMVDIQNKVARLEALLDEKKKELTLIEQTLLPEAMDSIGMSQFRLKNGWKVEVSPFQIISYKKENIDAVDEWLDEHGHKGLVKRNFIMNIPRTAEKEETEKLWDRLLQLGYELSDKKDIHYQTLNKWGREMTEEGETIPEEIFSVFAGKKAKITK